MSGLPSPIRIIVRMPEPDCDAEFSSFSREAKVQRAKVCLNCTEPSVFLLVASSRAVLVGYTLQGLDGGPREVNCEQYGRRAADVY